MSSDLFSSRPILRTVGVEKVEFDVKRVTYTRMNGTVLPASNKPAADSPQLFNAFARKNVRKVAGEVKFWG